MYLLLGFIIAHIIPSIYCSIVWDEKYTSKLCRWEENHRGVTIWVIRICAAIVCFFMGIGGVKATGRWIGILYPVLYLGLCFLMRWIYRHIYIPEAKQIKELDNKESEK